jgi:hypothetical protein
LISGIAREQTRVSRADLFRALAFYTRIERLQKIFIKKSLRVK